MKELEAALHLECITSNEDAEALKKINDIKVVVEERSILRELINMPTVDTTVLKEIYQIMFGGQHEKGIQTFLAKWKVVYYSEKKPLLDDIVFSMYDTLVNTEDFETYTQEQKGKRLDEDLELQLIIDTLHLEYQKSKYLNNNALEKLISLIIANDNISFNFYVVLNYICFRGDQDMKNKVLNSIYELRLVGFNQEADKSLLQL